MKYTTLLLASLWLVNAQAQNTDWEFCSVGLSASIMESSNQWTTEVYQGELLNQDAGSVDADDTAIALQLGCNFLETEQWVFGAKLAANDNKLQESQVYEGGVSPDNLLTYQIEDIVSLIGRVGFKSSKKGLIYANLGYTQTSHLYTDITQTPVNFSFRKRESQRGWLLGVGYEHLMSEQFSLFAEYNYTDLGENKFVLDDLLYAPTEYRAKVDQDISQFNVGINFNF